MCFRPAVVKNVCPSCGADNFPGVKECIKCGAELDGGHEPGSMGNIPPASPAAPAPGAPKPPSAPSAPTAPKGE